MKIQFHFIQLTVVLLACCARAQGTFLYDQQSSTNNGLGSFAAPIQHDQPIGQSFTPSLSGVGFIQLSLTDANFGNSLGATVYINLFSGSLTNGTLLGSTALVSMPDSFSSFTNFFFQTPISVTPGTTYYLQPIVQPGGDTWGLIADFYNYPGGTALEFGMPDPSGLDFWFREGMIVPEPSSHLLFLSGIAAFILYRRRHTPTQPLQKEPHENQQECFSHQPIYRNLEPCPCPKSTVG